MEAFRRTVMVGLLAATLGTAGCALPYLLQLADGELRVQQNIEPIADVLASGRLNETDAAKLELLVAARDYAAGTMGLNVGTAYSTFYDTHGEVLAWNLSAARREALQPMTWSFPIVGEVPYLSFFDETYLRRVERELQARGNDTYTYELDAYSTLGILREPVRSPMLKRNTLSLVETVIHELLHNTVWRPDETVFNESLATFVGRQGATEFLRAHFGDGSTWPQVALDFYADVDRANAFLRELYGELETYYAQPLGREALIAGREAIFQAARDRFATSVQPDLHYPASFASYAALPTNNAWILANQRYNLDLELFGRVYEQTGRDWPAALGVYRAAADADGDPFDYLRSWLAEQR